MARRIKEEPIVHQNRIADQAQKLFQETNPDAESFAGRTYQIGEEINRAIARFIKAGIEKKELKAQRNCYVTIFQLWGMIAGLIRLAAEKQEYIAFSEKMSKEEFLMDGFEKIYTMIQI